MKYHQEIQRKVFLLLWTLATTFHSKEPGRLGKIAGPGLGQEMCKRNLEQLVI